VQDNKKRLVLSRSGLAHNVSWTMSSRLGRQGLQMATTLVLAKLIAPSDFGLVGMTAVFLNFVGLFQDLGSSSSVIQIKETNEKLLSTVYWLNCFLGFLFMGIFYAAAGVISALYNEPRLTVIIYLLAWTFPIISIGSVQSALMERELGFKRISIFEMGATGLSSLVGIGSALMGMGALSLVFQSLVLSSCMTLLFVIFCDWKPRFHFSWVELKKIYKFSLNLTGFNIFNYFSRNADNFLIGKYLGAEALGWYAFAYNMMLVPLRNISNSTSRVLFPVLSKLQDDHKEFRSIYLDIVKHVALFTFPIVIGILAISKPFFMYFLGDKWMPALPVVYILMPLGFLQSVSSLNGSIYNAKGRSDLLFKYNVIFSSIIIASFVVGLQWGMIGVSAAYAISSLAVAYPNMKIPYKLVDLHPKQLAGILWPSLLCSCLMGVLVFLLGESFHWETIKAVKMAALVLTGIASYVLFTWYLNRKGIMDLIGLFKRG
jgi:O-antigen/teichoic acid export membrane protein